MTLNLLDWDEDLQTDSAEEYQALLNGVRRSQGFGLYFVQCSPFSGGKLIGRIQTDLTEKTIAVLKFEQPITDGNVFKRINTFLTDHAPVDVLLIQGLEKSLFDAEETKKRLGWSTEKANAYTWREVPPVLINLNQQRERFRDSFETCFVFLLPQYAIKYLIHRAPDFFDWRSGLVNYASDPDTLAQESERILQTSDYEAYCTWSEEERTSRLFAIQAIADEPETTLETRASLYFEQGLLFAAAQDFSAAMICFDKAATLQPDLHEALYNKGNALVNLGQYDDDAIAAYDQALAIKPDKHEALNNKGNVLFNLGQYEAAIAAYDQALTLKPDYHQALYNKGNVLADLGQYEAAIAAYDQALAIKPDYHEALYTKGVALVDLGQYKAAIAAYDQALTLKPNEPKMLYNKACGYGLQGDVKNAISTLQAAITLDPNYHDRAKTDSDFDPIRQNECFQALIEGEP
jgi:tetratricopeptide (TPR) repeat protein